MQIHRHSLAHGRSKITAKGALGQSLQAQDTGVEVVVLACEEQNSGGSLS